MRLQNDRERKAIYFFLLFLVAFSAMRCSQALTESFAQEGDYSRSVRLYSHD